MTKLANIEDADTVVTKVEAGDGVIKVTTKTKGVPSEENIEAGKVKSVNGMTGDVTIPEPNYPVTSVNGQTGAVQIPVNNGTVSEKYRVERQILAVKSKYNLTVANLTPYKPLFISVREFAWGNLKVWPISGCIMNGSDDNNNGAVYLTSYSGSVTIVCIPVATSVVLHVNNYFSDDPSEYSMVISQ